MTDKELAILLDELIAKFPGVLSATQKKNRIDRLQRELRAKGLIVAGNDRIWRLT